MPPVDPYRSEIPDTKLKRLFTWPSSCSFSEPGEWARLELSPVLECWNGRLLKISVTRLRVGLLGPGTTLGERPVVEAIDSGRSRLFVIRERRRAGWRSGMAGDFPSAMMKAVAVDEQGDLLQI